MTHGLEVLDIDPTGNGCVQVGGRLITVPGALPGDRVVCPPRGGPPRVRERGPREDILPCPHRACPGCPLLSTPMGIQLEAKRRRVARALENSLPQGLCPEVFPVEASPVVAGYRAGAKLVVGRTRRGVALGVYRRGSHHLVDIPRCPVHHPLVAAGVRAVRRRLRAAQALAGRGGAGWLRFATFQASASTGRLILVLVTRSADRGDLLRSLSARLVEDLPELTSVVWNVNPGEGNTVFGPLWEVLLGDGTITETFGSVAVRAPAGGFLQTNRVQATLAYREAVEWLDPAPDEEGADLFCGVGALTGHLALRCRRVEGIEILDRAVAAARKGAADRGETNTSFHSGAVEEVLPRLVAGGFRPSVVTLNPARKGVAPETLAALIEAHPRAVAYLSCNPTSLARDAAVLTTQGYRLEKVRPYDFLPLTAHVETLAHFVHDTR